jgi:hypothetical protein
MLGFIRLQGFLLVYLRSGTAEEDWRGEHRVLFGDSWISNEVKKITAAAVKSYRGRVGYVSTPPHCFPDVAMKSAEGSYCQL